MRISVFLFLFISLNVCAQQNAGIEYSRYSDKVPTSKISKELCDSIFRFVVEELVVLDFSDCNNCDSRAHITAAAIEKQFPGVHLSKAWIFTGHKRTSQSERYKFKKNDFLNYSGECGKWAYHVAPLIIIEHASGADSIVIDPAVLNEPVSLPKWASMLQPERGIGYLIVKDRKYFTFPDDEDGKFVDTKQLWVDDENEQLLDDDYTKSIEKILSSRSLIWDPWTYRHYITIIKDLLE